MATYYNELDAHAAQWLRNLIAAGHIAPGDVDERSIVDVRADDLRGYTQCHFFAGIGVWSYALRQAGWSDDREVWTGSCPCQPFSDAGKGEAFDDERDLWPVFFGLIRERRPRAVFGEQVASKLGLAWLDALHADMEGEAYTVGAVDTCSAGVGSPNIRQRFYWVAHADTAGLVKLGRVGTGHSDTSQWHDADGCGEVERLEHTERPRLEGLGRHGDDGDQSGRHGALATGSTAATGCACRLGDAARGRRGECGNEAQPRRGGHVDGADPHHRPGPANGFWRSADWLCCTDGKWRPVRPGTFPLVTGAPGRLGRLRAYGNAINAQVATEFIRAYMSVAP